MSNLFVARVGAVMSADIAVPEHARELAFYKQVLRTGDAPLWGHHGMNNLGIPVLGLGRRTPAFEALPLQWMPHIQVADVGASAQRAVDLGGAEVMHERDAAGRSQWAVLTDPDGAAFGIIPVVEAASMPPAARDATDDAPAGRIAWIDLTVADADRTRDFYREVIGWSVEDVTMQADGLHYADYSMLDAEGTARAGVCHARGANAALPPVWLLYVTVGDVEESLRRTEAEGGAVIHAARHTDGMCSYAVIRDPVGVHFAVVPA